MSDPATTPRLALVGRANCGKTALFNALTQQRQWVGNWDGVTVDQHQGDCQLNQHAVRIIDLPGIDDALACAEESSIDNHITCEVLCHAAPDMIINVVDARRLQSHLTLSLQLRELGIPMLLVINKADQLPQPISEVSLSQQLGCPVVLTSVKKKTGLTALTEKLDQAIAELSAPKKSRFPGALRTALQSLQSAQQLTHWQALQQLYHNTDTTLVTDAHEQINQHFYRLANRIYTLCAKPIENVQPSISERIDRIVLHRLLGLPIFFMVMYAVFFLAINIGGAWQDSIVQITDAIFVGLPVQLAHHLHAPPWVSTILTDGIGRGVSTTLSFVPILALLFLCLSILEESGYMARAAFVVDRIMRSIGLPGQAFIPMIIGFGCNVPAIMSTRNLACRRDRILTILMTPFMSCGARLAIFAIFAQAFWPHGGHNVIFLLYLIGLLTAVLCGLMVRKLLLKGHTSAWMMSLPDYQRPTLRHLRQRLWSRTRGFVYRAGKIIIPTCAILGALMHINFNPNTHRLQVTTAQHSALASVGRWMTPALAPMGVETDNWPATVGLLTGVWAKEVVIASLNTMYHTQSTHAAQPIAWQTALQQAWHSGISNTAASLKGQGNLIAASAPESHLTHSSTHALVQAFHTPYSAFCYLLFILLYFPCISTLAVMRQEIGIAWASFSLTWSTLIAYCIASCCQQALNWSHQPRFATIWLTACTLLITALLWCMHRYSGQSGDLDESETVIKAVNCKSICSNNNCHSCPQNTQH